MSVLKKIILTIFIVLTVGSILTCVLFSALNKVNTAKNLYNDVSTTFKSLYHKFNRSVAEFKNAKSTSYTLDICLEDTQDFPCTEVSLSNNSSDKYFEVSLKNLKLGNKSSIDLSTFTAKDEVGFYLESDPDIYYTVSGKAFRSNWNKSIYAKLVKMPDYIPENINYNKVSSLISVENFCKLFLGMGLGKEKINTKELINNLNISTPQSYTAYRDGKVSEAQIVHLTVPKEYIESVVEKLKKSSEKASFDHINSFLKNTEQILQNSPEKTLKIDFVISDNTLLWVETSAKLSSGIINARLDIYDNEVSFEVKQLMSQKSTKPDCSLKLTAGSSTDIKLSFTKGKKDVFKLQLQKQNDSSIVSDILFYDKNSNLYTVSAVYSPGSKKNQSGIPSKNIYSLSILDVLELYKKIEGTGQNLF